VRRIAVVGAGIAGLAAARGLARSDRVTLFEAADHFGGHAHTVDFTLGGRTHAVDTAFVVYNERAHPNVAALFAELGVGTATAEMSFSAQIPSARIEWSSASLGSVFAQRSNLLKPAFWNMLGEVRRFRGIAARLLARDSERHRATLDDGLGDFLQARRFSSAFRDWYLLPIVATIWSCPPEQMLRFPLGELLRFCAAHGLLQLGKPAPWRSVRGGASIAVDRMLDAIPDARRATAVRQVRRIAAGGVELATANGSERFDAVVLACHSDQALALLADPSDDERDVLGAIRWQRNRAVLHSDVRALPQRKAAWAAWNYERSGSREAGESGTVCVHVLVNRLQPLPFDAPAIVSLNPLFEPIGKLVQGEFHYAHPLFDRRAIAAQARLPALQGRRDTWYCGAWTGRGSHEDGLVSALAVCRALAR
jgi:predicted NAD/FAD-binding protein